jgi:Icc-related predicted phosphoesterase
MKIVAISDTHTQAARLTIPECDVLIHAGDSTYNGTFFEVREFVEWLKIQPAKRKIVIAGNHELSFDPTKGRHYNESTRNMLTHSGDPSIIYLENDSVEIDGVKFFGSPWTPWFHNWAFNGWDSRNLPTIGNCPPLKNIYQLMPADTQVVICHSPCYGVVDSSNYGNSDERLGSIDLLKQVQRTPSVKLVIGGHIHEARGIMEIEGRVHANVSSLDRDYQTIRPPMVFNIEGGVVTYEEILP